MTWLDLRKYYNVGLFLVIFIYLHSLRYFEYIGVNPTYHGWLSNLLVLFLIIICIISKNPRRMPAQYWMLGFLLVPMLSFLPCWLENGQSPLTSLRAYLMVGLALVYFLLHKTQMKPAHLIQILTAFAVIRIGILLLQQFTYPSYWFSLRPEGLNAQGLFRPIEVRSGIYRFCIEDPYLSMFLLFYYFQRLTKSFRPTYLVLFFLGLFGLWLDQTRQFMAVGFISFLLVFLFNSRFKGKWLFLLLVPAVIGVLLLKGGSLFEDLILMTQSDMGSDNIRLFAYSTYLFEFWGGPLSVVFGNGPMGNSDYGQLISYMYDSLNLYHSDVGIVGAINFYGLTTLFLFLAFYIFFVARYWKSIPMFLKMYFLAVLFNIPLISLFTQPVNCMVLFAMFLYLSDRSIIACNPVPCPR